MECAAIIDVWQVLEIENVNPLKQGKALLVRIFSMLTKLCPVR